MGVSKSLALNGPRHQLCRKKLKSILLTFHLGLIESIIIVYKTISELDSMKCELEQISLSR